MSTAPPAPGRWSPGRWARAVVRNAALDVTPLRHEHFRRLFVGNTVSVVGFQLTAVAVPLQVYALSRSTVDVGLVGVVGLAPLIVFGLWGGALVDAVDRRRTLLWSSIATWLCTVGLLVQALADLRSLGVILVLVAVQAGAFAVSSSARGAIVPRVLPLEDLPAGNTLEFTSFNVGTVAGPLIAGLLLAKTSYSVAYLIDALLFTAGLYAAWRLPPITPGEDGAGGGNLGLRSVIDGLSYIATKPLLGLSFAVDIAAMVLAMPRALFPAAAERFGDASAAGWLYAAISIGSVLAGLTSGWVGRVRRQGIALVVSIVGWGVAVAAAGLAHDLWLAVVMLAFGGAADLVSAVYRQTILQTYAPDELRGRLQGVFIVVVSGGPRVGDLRAGAMAAAVGVTASWVWGGLACAVLVLLALVAPSLRHYTVGDTDPATATATETDTPDTPSPVTGM